jgi:hypothetical protein
MAQKFELSKKAELVYRKVAMEIVKQKILHLPVSTVPLGQLWLQFLFLPAQWLT